MKNIFQQQIEKEKADRWSRETEVFKISRTLEELKFKTLEEFINWLKE